MSFRPTLWATIAAALVLAVLVGLGSWQLDRRTWKQELLNDRGGRIGTPAVDYSDEGFAAWVLLEGAEYRLISFAGRYRPGDTVKLLSRIRNGRAGFHIITPVEIETDAERVVILVDRGWVPNDRERYITPAPAGLVNIEGFVRRFETPGRFTPDNDSAAGAWFYLDREQLVSALKLEAVAPFYVQAVPIPPPAIGYPAGGVPDTTLRNPHLAYALTWYALALVLLVIYVIFHVRPRVGED